MQATLGVEESPALDLIREGLGCRLRLLDWRSGHDSRLVLHVDPLGRNRVGLLFLWSSLAFLEARPLLDEGLVPPEYVESDGWSSLDFLKLLRWDGTRLWLRMDVLRGRCVATELVLLDDGRFVVRARGRGDSPLHWFESFGR